MRAEVIAVGSELLTPFHIDTDSLFITGKLNEIGIGLQAKAVAGDDRAALKAVVADALERCDLLILTGGLGPTDDDLTREVVAELLNRPLEYHEQIFRGIEARFASRGLKAPDINRRQAMVPAGAAVLPNPNGTAPGLWLEHDGRMIALLPGPPRELKPMFEQVVRERLAAHAGRVCMLRRLLRIAGQSESSVEERMQPLYARWLSQAVPVSTTILASLGQIELHLTASAASAQLADAMLDAAARDAQAVLGQDIFTVSGESMPEVVGALCRRRRLRITAAESCTGGLVMTRLTDVPGSSEYVDEGIVVYSNQAKTARLGVPAALIAAHGAVSEPVARAMAEGAIRLAQADVSRRDHRNRRPVRRNAGQAGRHRRDCGRVESPGGGGHPRAHVPVRRRAGDGPLPGLPGGARHGSPLAHGCRGVKRLFAAVDLDEPTRRAVSALRTALETQLAGPVRGALRASWVDPHRIHITVEFLGDCDAACEDEARRAFELPLELPPFALTLAGLGAFPPAGPPRVLWLGVALGERELTRVREIVRRRLRGTREGVDRERFHPHVTLARFRSRVPRTVLVGLRALDAPAGPCLIDRVTLYESRVSPRGPSYQALATAPLKTSS